MLRIGSIFSGIGGLELGLERGGEFKTIWQCEINPYCRKVLRKHWPDTHIFKDVRELEEDIKYTTQKGFDLGIDLLCGGDPCQENSRARTSTSCSVPSMGQNFIDTVRFIRPTFVLRENPSAVRKDAPWPWWRMRSELEQIGYGVVPFRLRSCCIGGNHRRDRVYLFGVKQVHNGAYSSGLDVSWERDRKINDGNKKSQIEKQWIQPTPQRFFRRNPAPRICRRTDGISNRVDRIKALGNSVDVRQSTYIGVLIRQWLENLSCTL